MTPSNSEFNSREARLIGNITRNPRAHGKKEQLRAVAIIAEMPWEELSEEALIARYRSESCQATSEQALNELFRRYHAKLGRWCLAVTGDRESALDLAQ